MFQDFHTVKQVSPYNMNDSHQPNLSSNASNSFHITARDKTMMVVESFVFVLMNIAALLGNLMVCVAFSRNVSLRRVTNYFVLSLAITDLSMAVFPMPLKAIASITGRWMAEDIGCKVDYFIANISAGTSLLTVMLLAVNRYFHVVWPALYFSIFTKKRSIVMAVCAWIVTAAVVSLQFFITRIQFQTFTNLPALCIPDFPDHSVSVVFNVIQNTYISLPSLVIVVCYAKIFRTIRLHNTAGHYTERQPSVYGVEQARITRVLTVVVIGFYICWLPVLVTNILNFFKVIGASGIKYINFYITFPLSASSIINPVIYAAMSPSFRAEFWKILHISSTHTSPQTN